MIKEIRELFDNIHFGDACLQCGARCCFLPWIPKEECDLVTEFQDEVETLGNVHFFLDRRKCKFVNSGGVCEIYMMRPLDCRLFPLDIIEEDGCYYWCFYTVCPNLAEIKERLQGTIQDIEVRISENLWRQFKEQIAISKEIYEPYRTGQYEIVREFTKFS